MSGAAPVLAAEALTARDVLSYHVSGLPFLLSMHLLQALVLLALVRLVDWHERESWRLILAVFLWGGTGAIVLSGVLNMVVLEALPPVTAVVYGPAIAAPLVEELAKGVVLLGLFGASMAYGRRTGRFVLDGPSDGIVYGIACGFGFAFFENVHYFVGVFQERGMGAGVEVFLMRTGLADNPLSLLRGHGTYTALLGAGIGLASWANRRSTQTAFIAAGFGLSMLAHASWNGLLNLLLVRRFGTETVVSAMTGQPLDVGLLPHVEAAVATYARVRDLIGWAFTAAVAVTIILWLRYQARVVRFELAEEVRRGLVPPDELEVALQPMARLRTYGELLRRGETERLHLVRHRHDELTTLGMLKWRLRWVGGDPVWLDRQRRHVELLGDSATALARRRSADPA